MSAMTADILAATVAPLALVLGYVVGRRRPRKVRTWRTATFRTDTQEAAYYTMRNAAAMARALNLEHCGWEASSIVPMTLTVAWLSGTPSGDIVEDALVQCGAVGG